MSQFNCPICNEGFEQKSKYQRHMETSHPKQASSASDLAKVLNDVEFPVSKDELVTVALSRGFSSDTINLVRQLPMQSFRDSAEVMRSLGQAKSLESKPTYMPSKKGGREAAKSYSASRVAKVLRGVSFPKSAHELKNFAKKKTKDKDVIETFEQFSDKKYNNMADVEKEFQIASQHLHR